MQWRDGVVHLSPTDLVRYLGCAHATFLDLQHLAAPRSDWGRAEPDDLLIQKGLEHEAAYLQALKDAGKRVVEIRGDVSRDERLHQTTAALQSGADIVYQAELAGECWGGKADFLVRTDDAPSALGPFHYEVADTKFARRAKPEYVIQLGVYSGLLTATQGRQPRHMYVVLDGQEKECFREQDFAAYVRHARRRLELFVAQPPNESYPQPCAHCVHCDWQERCTAQWKQDDHLSLVANIQTSQREKLERHGVKSLAALATMPAGTRVPELNALTLERLRAQAALQLHKRNTFENKYEILPSEKGRGFARLPKPDAGDLFFDMEGDPLYPAGLEYLFGVCCRDGGELRFRAFWAHDHDQERATFRGFMAFLGTHLAEHPGAHIYHYNHYELTALRRLSDRYAVAEHQLNDLQRRHKFVDLYKVVREALRVSEPSYSLKNLETFYMPQRTGEVASASDSIKVYNRWRVSGAPNLLDDIAAYNEVDCRSTAGLRDWLLTLRPNDMLWFSDAKPEHDSDLDEGKSAERRERERQYADYQRRLHEAAAADKNDYRQHLADLLGFHDREAKPQWWAFFDRQDRTEDELLDDAECLAALQLCGAPIKDKRSLVYTYRFPAQDTKRRSGESVKNATTGENVGAIHELDEKGLLVRLRVGPKTGSLPERLSIGPGDPIPTKVLTQALNRVADDALQGAQRYRAVIDLLAKALPRIAGREPGAAVVQSADVLEATTDAVASLDHSVLFIQGPPGAGKTYTTAHVIVEMMRRGKRVGVAANSHMAINNLLTKVEELAVAGRVKFTGVKKSSGDESDFNGQFIHSVRENDEVDLDAELLAGTAWLFARPEFEQHLDYLFIDEAGQVALANVVAMGTAAKSIVLVGDQMQLGQPIQGVHPGQAGLSVLDFLLGEQATVPPERGIFLSRTWRMRPEVCRFISEAFYDSRLEPDPSTSARELVFAGHKLDGMKTAGIHFHPAAHVGCSQKSAPEGEIVKGYVERLLAQQFQEKGKPRRALTIDDILVVSPYNMQVNYLRSILPEGARVGTVDKFQGQEAPVVIVSMTTSGADEQPRDIEFLFSANRLNVAVSRAQCLAIVVASPELLKVPCASIEQLRLVNKFCLLAEMA